MVQAHLDKMKIYLSCARWVDTRLKKQQSGKTSSFGLNLELNRASSEVLRPQQTFFQIVKVYFVEVENFLLEGGWWEIGTMGDKLTYLKTLFPSISDKSLASNLQKNLIFFRVKFLCILTSRGGFYLLGEKIWRLGVLKISLTKKESILKLMFATQTSISRHKSDAV